MFLFFLEQIVLLFCVYYFFRVSSEAQLLISIFALVVVTTATLEKFILEKKYEYQKKKVDIVTYENEEMLKQMKILSNEYKKLYQKYVTLKKKR